MSEDLPPIPADYAEDDESWIDDDYGRGGSPLSFWTYLIGILAWLAVIFGVWAFLLAIGAYAHESMGGMRYDAWCCHGNDATGDCQAIPDTSVKPIPGGYQITLRAGDHHMVTKEHVFTKKQAETRWSTDGRYHACLYPTEEYLHCFYAPIPGV